MIVNVPVKIDEPMRTYSHHLGGGPSEMVTEVFYLPSGSPVLFTRPKNPTPAQVRKMSEWFDVVLKHLKEEIEEGRSAQADEVAALPEETT
jgi:hypothetical protein